MDSRRRRRSSCASRRRSISPPAPPASGSSRYTSIRRPRPRSASRPPRARCAACSSQGVDYIVETAPNIDAGGTLVQIVPLRPLLAEQRRARRDPPARYRLPGARDQCAARDQWRADRRRRRLRDDQDGRAREPANGTCATITDARLQRAVRTGARALRRRRRRGRESRPPIVVSAQLHHAVVDTVLRVISATVAASPPPATAGAARAGRHHRRHHRPGGPESRESAFRHDHAALLPEHAGGAARRHRHRADQQLVARGESAAGCRRPAGSRRANAISRASIRFPAVDDAAHRAHARSAFRARRP